MANSPGERQQRLHDELRQSAGLFGALEERRPVSGDRLVEDGLLRRRHQRRRCRRLLLLAPRLALPGYDRTRNATPNLLVSLLDRQPRCEQLVQLLPQPRRDDRLPSAAADLEHRREPLRFMPPPKLPNLLITQLESTCKLTKMHQSILTQLDHESVARRLVRRVVLSNQHATHEHLPLLTHRANTALRLEVPVSTGAYFLRGGIEHDLLHASSDASGHEKIPRRKELLPIPRPA
jgi:hypothetical protein